MIVNQRFIQTRDSKCRTSDSKPKIDSNFVTKPIGNWKLRKWHKNDSNLKL